MMERAIFLKSYSEQAFDKTQILRYMGCRSATDEISKLIDSCVEECRKVCTHRVCAEEFPIHKATDVESDLGFCRVRSASLSKHLEGCDKIILFAATVGLGIDRLTVKYSRLSPSRAFCIQAIGAERIEALCDTFCDEMSGIYARQGYEALPRFSPGYGDLALETQKNIFAALECETKIGVTLNQSLLMSPSKSVTAIIGLRPLRGGKI